MKTKVIKEISPTLFREKTMSSIRLGWKLSVAVALLAAILAFSFSIASVNGPEQYRVTFGQTGLDASATGTVVTVEDSAKTYVDLPFELWVDRDTRVRYSYEDVVSSSVSGMRYRLDTVSGSGSPIRVRSDTTVTGNYITQYYLTVTSPYDTPSGQGWYDTGSSAYATLESGTVSGGTGIRYVFTGWSGDASGTGLKSNAITINGPKTATANWKTQYYITVTSPHDNPTPSAWVDAGSDFTASVTSPTEIVPNDYEWVCTGFSVDGGAYQNGTTYTFTNVQAPHSIDFAWKQQSLTQQFWIQVNSLHGSPTTSQWIEPGGSLTVSVTSPADDDGMGTRYRCTGYKIDDGSLQAGTSYTFTNVKAAHKIEFQWITQYQITFIELGPEAARAITLTVDGSSHSGTTIFTYYEWFDKDSSVAFSVTDLIDSEITGKRYALINWKNGAGSVIGSPQTITGPNTFTAYYKTQYELTVDTNPSGISAISGSGWYDDETLVTAGTAPITVTSGGVVYTFSTWMKDGVAVSGNPMNILMDAPHIAMAYYTSPTPPETGNLQIYVKDSNNNPISGTTVLSASQPSGQSQLSGTTDTNGYVTFNNILAGSYSVEASKSGYITSTKSVTVTSDQTTTETMQLQLREIGDLLVFVKDSNNNPIIGANITSTSQPFGATTLKGVTDSAGYATFLNIVSGVYFIQVSKTGYDSASKQVTVGTEKVTTSTVLLQTKMTPSTPTTQAVPLWIYIAGLLVLWAATITVLVLVLRANGRDHMEEVSQKPIHHFF
jgi:uncharacterized repeat protein (TIGR02543 family)